MMCETLGINPESDYATLEWLGNTGSVALPITLAIAVEEGFIGPDENVGLLGIGSGINCLMLAVSWQQSRPTLRGGQSSEQSLKLATASPVE